MMKSDIDVGPLRLAHRLQCHLTDCPRRMSDSDERMKFHFAITHQDILEGKQTTLAQLIEDCRRTNQNDTKIADRGDQVSSGQAVKDVLAEDSRLDETTSPTRLPSTRPISRERSVAGSKSVFDGYKRAPIPLISQEQLDADVKIAFPRVRYPSTRPISQEQPVAEVKSAFARVIHPSTRPISQEQPVAEVKSAFVGVVHKALVVEAKSSNNIRATKARQQQRSHYTKALDPPTPFTSARDSITTRRKNSLRSFLPVLVDGKITMALPDTQASHNIVTKDYVVSVGARIDRDPAKLRTFTNAVGGKIYSSGTVQMDVALLDHPTRLIKVTFSVVEKCPESLVLGSSFLEEHKIFTKNGYSHNTVKVSPGLTHSKGYGILRVMHMGDLQRQLVCTVDHRYALAKADSGSDVNLLSREYASSMGFQIRKIQTGENDHVMLADGSTEQLDGYVVADFSVNGSQTPLKFYILKDLVCDILLGDDTLESLDAFRKFPAAFVTQDHQEEPFHLIRWAERLRDVENDVEDILRSLDDGQDLPQRVGRWNWLRSAFSKRADKSPRHDPKEIIRQLRDRLHEINIIESEYCAENAQRVMGLTGAELFQEQEYDKRRRKVHDELRDRISKHIRDLSTPERTPGAPSESRSTTTNSSGRT